MAHAAVDREIDLKYPTVCRTCRRPMLAGERARMVRLPGGTRAKYMHVDSAACTAAPTLEESVKAQVWNDVASDARSTTIRVLYKLAVKQGCKPGHTRAGDQIIELLAWCPASGKPAPTVATAATPYTATHHIDAADRKAKAPSKPSKASSGYSLDNVWSYAQDVVTASRVSLAYGIPGTGKSTLGYTVGMDTGREVTKVTINQDTSYYDLVGGWRINETGGMSLHVGPVAVAFRDGHMLVVDELVEAAPAVTLLFVELYDAPEIARLTMPDGTVIKPHAEFKSLCTTNGKPGDFLAALLDRFEAKIQIDEPSEEAIKTLSNDLQDLARSVCNAQCDKSRFISFRELRDFDKIRTQNPAFPLSLVAEVTIGGQRGQELATSLELS